jgi:hypothetical protein
MPDVVGEHHHVRVRYHLGVAACHVRTGVRIDRPVDQPHRNFRLPHRPHPPISVRKAVVNEATDLVQYAAAVVVIQDLVEHIHHVPCRFGVRAEHLAQRRLQQPTR